MQTLSPSSIHLSALTMGRPNLWLFEEKMELQRARPG
jgi:hypothetical protein